ncbi:MAG: adhesin, partial [Methylocystis sp.]
NSATALGTGATATGIASTAVGAGANTAGFNGSTAIGAGATNTAANQITLGTKTNAVAAPGLGVGGASTAAQVGATNFVTTDANGTLGASNFGPGSIANLNNSVNILGANVAALNQQVFANQREARRGIAASAAIPPTLIPSAPGLSTLNFASSFYRGQAGFGVTGAHRLDTALPLVLQGSYSNGGGREHVGRIAAGFEF